MPTRTHFWNRSGNVWAGSNSPLGSYAPWGPPAEPDDADGEDCVAQILIGGIYDWPCEWELGYACELP